MQACGADDTAWLSLFPTLPFTWFPRSPKLFARSFSGKLASPNDFNQTRSIRRFPACRPPHPSLHHPFAEVVSLVES
jgi:hypothetical protein